MDVRGSLSLSTPSFPFLPTMTFISLSSRTFVRAKTLRMSSSTTGSSSPSKNLLLVVHQLEHLAACLREVYLHPVEKEGGFIEKLPIISPP